jgi:hypothetical protein
VQPGDVRRGKTRRQQGLVERGAHQQLQRVDVARDLAVEARGVRTRGFDDGARLREIEARDRAQLVALLRERERGLVRLERCLRQAQQLAVGGEREPRVGDLGDEAQLRRAPRLLGGEEFAQRRLRQVAHAAEEV